MLVPSARALIARYAARSSAVPSHSTLSVIHLSPRAPAGGRFPRIDAMGTGNQSGNGIWDAGHFRGSSPSSVIGVAAENAFGAIKLLRQHAPHQHVRPCQP